MVLQNRMLAEKASTAESQVVEFSRRLVAQSTAFGEIEDKLVRQKEVMKDKVAEMSVELEDAKMAVKELEDERDVALERASLDMYVMRMERAATEERAQATVMALEAVHRENLKLLMAREELVVVRGKLREMELSIEGQVVKKMAVAEESVRRLEAELVEMKRERMESWRLWWLRMARFLDEWWRWRRWKRGIESWRSWWEAVWR